MSEQHRPPVLIRGSKGPKEPPKPTEATDTLSSISYARIIDAICEGPVEGLVDGARSIFFDDVALQNPDGSYNFENVVIETREGTHNQDPLQDFAFSERQVDVGIEVKHGDEPVRVLYDTNVDTVVFRLTLAALSYRDDNGNVVGTSVQFSLHAKDADGVAHDLGVITITGKASSRYDRDIACTLPAGSFPWSISVKRVTADDATSDHRYRNQTYWTAYIERVNAKLNYRHTALAAVTLDARAFSNVPTRRYNMRLRKVRVPANRLPDLEREISWGKVLNRPQYLGIWDGTFKSSEEWSRNPAWCMYDLATHYRYGLGQYLDPQPLPGDAPPVDPSSPFIDKWSVYEIGKNCDELVPDGKGGWEPRFALNCYWQTQQEAYQALSQIASVFRGMMLWAGSQMMLTADVPRDAVKLFTNSNVVDGIFGYSGESKRKRITAVYVTWNDPEDGYRRVVDYVDDREAIARYGLQVLNLTAFGCTSPGQARRAALWVMFSSLWETGQIRFKTGTQAAMLLPGEIIKVMDEHLAGQRWGGMITGKGSELVNGIVRFYLDLDAPTFFRAGVLYTVFYYTDPDTITRPDGYGGTVELQRNGGREEVAQEGSSIVRSATFSVAADGEYSRIHFDQFIAKEPDVGSMWNISEPGTLEPAEYRVVGVSDEGDGTYSVVAMEHFGDKYAAIEQEFRLPDENSRPPVVRPVAPQPVYGFSHEEELYAERNLVKTSLALTWQDLARGNSYRIRYRYDGLTGSFEDGTDAPAGTGAWVTFDDHYNQTSLTLLDVLEGYYTFEVLPFNVLGITAPTAATYQFAIKGKLTPPAAVDSNTITATLESGGVLIGWDAITDIDRSSYIVKATPLDPGTYYGQEELVGETTGTRLLYAAAKGKGSTFLFTIQSVDTGGRRSVTLASKEVSFEPPGIVQDFSVTQNIAYLDFHWRAAPRAAGYQLRAGDQWETAEYIGETKDTQLSLEWARTGVKRFWVRAYDALGNPSPLPTGEDLDVAKPPMRNEVQVDVLVRPRRLTRFFSNS